MTGQEPTAAEKDNMMLSIINGDKVIEWTTDKPEKVRDSIKRSRQIHFLKAFAVCGNITRAGKAAGVNHSTVRNWRENDEWFRIQFKDSLQSYRDVVEQEIHDRAITGVEVPIIGRVQTALGPEDAIIGTKVVKSDLLLMFQAKRHITEYRDKYEPPKDDGKPVESVSPMTRITIRLDMMGQRQQEQIPASTVIDITPRQLEAAPETEEE